GSSGAQPLSPGLPIDRLCFAIEDFDIARRNVVRERDRVETIPPCAWRNEPVKSEKVSRLSGRLRFGIVSVAISIDIHAKFGTPAQMGKPKHPSCRYPDLVREESNF